MINSVLTATVNLEKGCSNPDFGITMSHQLMPAGVVSDYRQNFPVSSEEEVRYPKGRACGLCGARLPSAKELRAHKALVHALPTCSTAKTTYRRLVAAKIIKKEEKADDITVGECFV